MKLQVTKPLILIPRVTCGIVKYKCVIVRLHFRFFRSFHEWRRAYCVAEGKDQVPEDAYGPPAQFDNHRPSYCPVSISTFCVLQLPRRVSLFNVFAPQYVRRHDNRLTMLLYVLCSKVLQEYATKSMREGICHLPNCMLNSRLDLCLCVWCIFYK